MTNYLNPVVKTEEGMKNLYRVYFNFWYWFMGLSILYIIVIWQFFSASTSGSYRSSNISYIVLTSLSIRNPASTTAKEWQPDLLREQRSQQAPPIPRRRYYAFLSMQLATTITLHTRFSVNCIPVFFITLWSLTSFCDWKLSVDSLPSWSIIGLWLNSDFGESCLQISELFIHSSKKKTLLKLWFFSP